EEAFPQIKRLEIREPRVTRKAVFGQSLEEEPSLRILPLGIALGRIVGTPGQRAAQKADALWHILAMRVEVLGVLGEGLEPRLDPLALLGRLKPLGMETRGEDGGEGLEKRVHGGGEGLLGGGVPRPRLPMEAECQEHEQRGQSHWVSSYVHG